MSAQDKLDRSTAKHGLGSDERKRKIQKAKDFFSKPVPSYSKDELRKMGHPVEQNESRFDITFPEPTAKNTARKNPAVSARNRANAEKHKDKIQKAIARDKARSASGSLTRTDDHRRKNYQTGKSGAHFSKYESTTEYGKSMDRIRDKEKNAAIKPKDRKTLSNLTDLMKKQRKEAYRKPTQAEIDADKRKERKASGEKRPSASYKSIKKKVYGNAMGGLKDAAGQEFTAVPLDTTGEVSGGDRMSIAKLNAIMQKRTKDKRQKESVNLEETNESSLPPHLQKIIGKDGQIDKKKVDQHVHGKKTKVTDVTPKGYGPKESVEQVDEATMADRTVLRAVRIARDMAGNHTGASKRIEKMKKGLSDHPKVKAALRTHNEAVDDWKKHHIDRASANLDNQKKKSSNIWKQLHKDAASLKKSNSESVSTADKKPQNFRDPNTGKLKTRMVPVDKDVVRGNDKAKVVKKKTFRSMRNEQKNEKI